MSIKHSIALRARWAKVDPKKRSKLMSKVATIKHSQLTPDQRSKHAKKMSDARTFNIKK